MEKSCRTCAPKASPRPLHLVNNPKQPLHGRNSSKNKIFWKGVIKNLLKSQHFLPFRTQPLLMDKVIKSKRDLELVTSHSSGYETSSQKFIYYLTKFDGVT